MILRITVSDNDFTRELEDFAKDIELFEYAKDLYKNSDSNEVSLEFLKAQDRFRELFYNTEKYTPELADELCAMIKHRWELWVNNCMKDHPWWDAADSERIKGYLIRDFKVKFQKSLTPKWENGEVVYICCGYHRRWWTF